MPCLAQDAVSHPDTAVTPWARVDGPPLPGLPLGYSVPEFFSPFLGLTFKSKFFITSNNSF